MHRQTIVACFCNTKDRIATKNIDDEISTQGAYYKAGLLISSIIPLATLYLVWCMSYALYCYCCCHSWYRFPCCPAATYYRTYVRTYMFAYNIEFGMPVLSAKLDHNLIPNTSTGSTALLASCDILILYLGIKVTSFEFQLIQFSKNVE